MKLKEHPQSAVSLLPEASEHVLKFAPEVHTALIHRCFENLPNQSFGVLTGDRPGVCRSFVLFEKNIRNMDPEIQKRFAAYGAFYGAPHRGYWIDPWEQLDLLLRLEEAQQQITAIFHTHLVLDAQPTAIDRDLHYHREVPMVILSFSEAQGPKMRAYRFKDGGWQPLRIEEMSAETD